MEIKERIKSENGIIARKDTSAVLLILGGAAFVFGLVVLIISLLSAEYFEVIFGAVIVVLGLILLGMYLVSRKMHLVVRQTKETFLIYDDKSRKTYRLRFQDIVDVTSSPADPKRPKGKGFVIVKTSRTTAKTFAVDDYEKIKVHMLEALKDAPISTEKDPVSTEAKPEPAKQTAKPEPAKQDKNAKQEPAKQEPAKQTAKPEPAKQDKAAKPAPAKQDKNAKKEATKKVVVKPEPAKKQPAKQEPAPQVIVIKQESAPAPKQENVVAANTTPQVIVIKQDSQGQAQQVSQEQAPQVIVIQQEAQPKAQEPQVLVAKVENATPAKQPANNAKSNVKKITPKK